MRTFTTKRAVLPFWVVDIWVDGDAERAVSVCLPVHNAEDAVVSALSGVTTWDYDGPLHLICVPNGCTDRSAERARSAAPLFAARGWRLTVSEIDAPQKVAALKHAESLASEGWFLALDVHVRPHRDALRQVLEHAETRDLSVASAQLRYVVEGSAAVRRFARAYGRTPYARGNDLKGTFVAVAPDRRHLVAEMPGVGSEDRYYLRATPRDQRGSVDDAVVEYHFPGGLKSLVRQQARWHRNNAALDDRLPGGDPPAHEADRWPYFSPRPSMLDIATYAAVWTAAFALARIRPTESTAWSR